MNSRTRRLVKAIISGFAGRVIALATPLFAMGPMLDYLGAELFGMWLTAVSIASVATVMDLGIGLAAITRLSDAFGREDIGAVRKTLGEAYVLLASVCIFCVLVAIVSYTISSNLIFDDEKVAVLVVVMISLFVSFPASLFWRYLQARHAFVQSQLAQVIGPILGLATCLWGIEVELNPIVVVALYAFANSIALLIWASVYFLLNADQRPSFNNLDIASMRSLLGMGGGFFILSIFTLSGMNADNVVIAAITGTETVTEYGVPAKLGSILMLIVGTMYMPLWPLFGDALARRDKEWLAKTIQRMSLIGALIVLLVGVSMAVSVGPLMNLWMGRPFADQTIILLGWTATAVVISVTAPYNMVLNAAGRARPQIIPWVVFAVISITAKSIIITDVTAWLAPWITAVVYLVIIMPRILPLALSEIDRTRV